MLKAGVAVADATHFVEGVTPKRNVRAFYKKTESIIMCTLEAQKTRAVEAIKAGVNNCVVRPFTVEWLGE